MSATVYKGEPPTVIMTCAGPVKLEVARVPSDDFAIAAPASPATRRVYAMRRRNSDDVEVMCWADAPAEATQMEIEATDSPDGDEAPIIAIDYDARSFERDDGLGTRCWPYATYEADDLKWYPVDLDTVFDGAPLRELLEVDQRLRRDCLHTGLYEAPRLWWIMQGGEFTAAQREAISAHLSAELRAKVAASAERERCQVLVDLQEVE